MGLTGNLVVQLTNPETGEALPSAETGLVIVPLEDLIPREIPGTATKDGLYLSSYGVPYKDEGFIRLTYSNQDDTYIQVWHRSWDGRDLQLVFEWEPSPISYKERFFTYMTD